MNKTSLKKIIEDIRATYENLNELADIKTAALKENDIKKLDSIMRQEELCNKKILKLIQDREDFLKEHYELNPIEREEIERASERLRVVSDEFSKKNELNQSLVRQSLYYVNFNLNMLTPQDNTDTYTPPQNKKPSRKPNRVFMDSRV